MPPPRRAPPPAPRRSPRAPTAPPPPRCTSSVPCLSSLRSPPGRRACTPTSPVHTPSWGTSCRRSATSTTDLGSLRVPRPPESSSGARAAVDCNFQAQLASALTVDGDADSALLRRLGAGSRRSTSGATRSSSPSPPLRFASTSSAGRTAPPSLGGEGSGRQAATGAGAGLLAALRESVLLSCLMADSDDPAGGASGDGDRLAWPTDVHHIPFDRRLHGFLGLSVEFQLEIRGQVPIASAVTRTRGTRCQDPPVLLLQERMYAQDGLKAERIFRVTPENSQEEHSREQLNSCIVPDDIDVHSL